MTETPLKDMTPEQIAEAVSKVTPEQMQARARTLLMEQVHRSKVDSMTPERPPKRNRAQRAWDYSRDAMRMTWRSLRLSH